MFAPSNSRPRLCGHRNSRRSLAALMALAPIVLAMVLAGLPTRAASAVTQTISVRAFGARGDGVTNDTPSIQRAMNSVRGPKTIVFPAGTYRFANVIVPSDTSIVFESRASARIAPTGGMSDKFFWVFGTAASRRANVTLAGGTFFGGANTVAVLHAEYADNISVSRTHSRGARANVSANHGSTRITVRNCSADDALNGFSFTGCRYVTVSGCYVQNVRQDGIIFYGRCQYVAATGNTVYNYATGGETGRAGVHMYGSSDGTVTGNTVVKGNADSTGIRFRDSNRFWCADNYVEASGEIGLGVTRIGDFPGLDGGDVVMTRNAIVRAKDCGIVASSVRSRPVAILDNVIRDTLTAKSAVPAAGIRADTPGSTVIGNVVDGSQGAGIEVGGWNILVAGNAVRRTSTGLLGPRAGMWIDGTQIAVASNVVAGDYRSMVTGVRLYQTGSAVIRGNTVSGFTREAVLLQGTLLASIDGDVIPPAVTFGQRNTNDGAVVELVARDSGSRVAGIRYSLDGDRLLTVGGQTAKLFVTTRGSHAVGYSAIDAAGNTSAWVTRKFTVTVPPRIGAATIQRVAGSSRIDTAIAASKKAFPHGAETVVIVTAANWPDGLSAASLAGAYHAPVLLTYPGSLPWSVSREISRLRATKAIIVGGIGSVGSSVQTALRGQLGSGYVTRVSGSDRYGTAAAVARATTARLAATSGYDGTVLVATGAGFPDALSGSPLSAAKGWPIVLARTGYGGALSSATREVLTSISARRAVILGSANVVSAAAESDLVTLLGRGNVVRLGGKDRYATALEIARYGVESCGQSWDGVALASGADFPDALSGSAMQARSRSVLLLTPAGSLPPGVAARLASEKSGIRYARVLGGVTSVSARVSTALGVALR
jgi:putative cell wall-binding protein